MAGVALIAAGVTEVNPMGSRRWAGAAVTVISFRVVVGAIESPAWLVSAVGTCWATRFGAATRASTKTRNSMDVSAQVGPERRGRMPGAQGIRCGSEGVRARGVARWLPAGRHALDPPGRAGAGSGG